MRLQEGGAARVALDLHRQLLNAGIESRFAYGWGEKGGRSSAEALIARSFQAGQRMQVVANMLLHKVLGVDLMPPIGSCQKGLIEALDWADVIHLHVIHSYYLPLEWLVKKLTQTGKPVVWTAHDSWMQTGRCAFTEGCESWRQGCGACPTLRNYPPVWFDFSAVQFRSKRRLISMLGQQLHVTTPSRFMADAIRDGFPGISVSVIPNWVDSEFEAARKNAAITRREDSSSKILKVLVLASDLSDPTKTDRWVIEKLLEMPHIEVHAVGKNSPFAGGRIINYGRISDRKQMVEIISSADVSLFTSEKDTMPLAMLEALACGVPVLAVDSLAAKEVLGVLDIKSIQRQAMVALLSDFAASRKFLREQYVIPKERFSKSFSAESALEAYRKVYQSCLTGTAAQLS